MGIVAKEIYKGVIFSNWSSGSLGGNALIQDMALIYSGSGADSGSFVFSGSKSAKLYFSGSTSGKMGIGTTSPTNDVDIKTDTFKIRSKDGTKEIEFGDEGFLKTRKFSGVGADGAAELTGSELVMSYSPGTFASPLKARAGDVMGSIRWEDESYNLSTKRGVSTPTKIDGIITGATAEGITGYISVKTTAAVDEGPTETLAIRPAGLYVTGSIQSSGNSSLGNAVTDTHTLTGHITASGNISASGYISASAMHSTTGIFGNITSAARIYANLGAGTDNSVVVNSGGQLVIDEIDAGVWGAAGAVVTAEGEVSAPTVATIAGLAPNTATTQATQPNITSVGTLTNINTSGNITASGNISASGNVWSSNYYQFEATAKGDTDDDDNWQGPNSYGIHTRADWNYDFGTDYDDITAVNEETRTLINTGWRVPHGANYSASVVNMDIYVTANSNITHADNDNFSCSLWYSKASDMAAETNKVDASPGAFNQRHAATAISTQFKASDEALYKYNTYHVSASIGLDLAPGSILFPRIKTVGTNDFNTVFHWIVNYKKIPL